MTARQGGALCQTLGFKRCLGVFSSLVNTPYFTYPVKLALEWPPGINTYCVNVEQYKKEINYGRSLRKHNSKA